MYKSYWRIRRVGSILRGSIMRYRIRMSVGGRNGINKCNCGRNGNRLEYNSIPQHHSSFIYYCSVLIFSQTHVNLNQRCDLTRRKLESESADRRIRTDSPTVFGPFQVIRVRGDIYNIIPLRLNTKLIIRKYINTPPAITHAYKCSYQ